MDKGCSRQRERKGCLQKEGYKEGLYKGCSGTWRGLAQCDWRLQCVVMGEEVGKAGRGQIGFGCQAMELGPSLWVVEAVGGF